MLATENKSIAFVLDRHAIQVRFTYQAVGGISMRHLNILERLAPLATWACYQAFGNGREIAPIDHEATRR